MTLLWIEGWDHEGTDTNLTRKGWTVSNTDVDPSSAAARTGANGLRLPAFNRQIYRDVTSSGTLLTGFAFRTSSATSGVTFRVCSFWNGGTCEVQVVLSSLTLQVWNGNNSTQLGTGSVLLLNTWYYIEFKAAIANSGSWELRVNNVNVSSGSGDTSNSGTASGSRVQYGQTWSGTQSASADYDDNYIANTSGSVNNDFLGDCKVETIMPNGNGNYSQFTGSDGNSTDNYLLVDETTPNDDTDYVEDGTVGDIDSYALANLATTAGTVYGVQTTLLARKTDAGSRSVASVARLSTTDDVSSDHSLLDTYAYWTDMREAKPGGGSWSISDVNSLEVGQKVTA